MSGYFFCILTVVILISYICLLDVFSMYKERQFHMMRYRFVNDLLIILVLFITIFLIFNGPLDSYCYGINRTFRHIVILSIWAIVFMPILIHFMSYVYNKKEFEKFSKIDIFGVLLIFIYYINFYFIYEIAFFVNIFVFSFYVKFVVLYLKRKNEDKIGYEFIFVLIILFLLLYFLSYTFFKFI